MQTQTQHKTYYNRTASIALSAMFFLLHSSLFSQSLFPTPDHIVIAIFENHAYTDIIGSSSAPYMNALATDSNSALFTQYYGIEHPSQPNYLDLYSGCNQGVTDDNVPASNPFTTTNLGRQLIDAGKTFATYSEDLPSVGYNGASSANYARKHNPAANWMGSGANQIPTTTNQPFSVFPSSGFSSLPTVCYVVPNQNNDMHNGSDPTRIVTGDAWFHNNLNAYIQWAKTNNSLFILTFDEDDLLAGNQIVTIFNGSMVKSGQYAQSFNHYSTLRTIEDMYGLPYACNASSATSVSNCWLFPTAISETELDNPALSISPNPATNQLNISTGGAPVESVRIYTATGQLMLEVKQPLNNAIDINTLSNGVYVAEINVPVRQAGTKESSVMRRWVKM